MELKKNIFPQCLGKNEFKYYIVCLYLKKKEIHRFQLENALDPPKCCFMHVYLHIDYPIK